jgi:hypothetical protein
MTRDVVAGLLLALVGRAVGYRPKLFQGLLKPSKRTRHALEGDVRGQVRGHFRTARASGLPGPKRRTDQRSASAKIAAGFNITLRRVLQRSRTAYALLFGYAYECKNLSGRHRDVDMGIVINSDLSVTCNSDDMYGHGQLGSLRETPLKTLLQGGKASAFRHSLSRGILPIPECGNCPALAKVGRSKVVQTAFSGSLPSILIENTSTCNVQCLSCNRTAIAGNRRLRTMSEAHTDRVIRELSGFQIETIRLFNLGEPFASNNILHLTNGLRRRFPQAEIITSTNGTLLKGRDKLDATLQIDELNFTIPGVDQASVERYQQGQDFAAAYANLCAAVRYRDENGWRGATIVWKYLIFNWNDSDEQLRRAIELAIEARVDILRFVVCVSPIFGISLKYVLGKSILGLSEMDIGYRHRLELIKHRYLDLTLRTDHLRSESRPGQGHRVPLRRLPEAGAFSISRRGSIARPDVRPA